MATGLINLPIKYVGLVSYFGKESRTSSASWSNTVYGYARDYLSYSSETFTVKKPFSASVVIYGKGSYYQGSGGGGRRIEYTFKKTSSGTTSTIASGTITANGGGTTSANVSFKTGDTFTLTLSMSGSGTCGTQGGFFMSVTS